MGPESEEKKEMLIIDGNAFYEIDLMLSLIHISEPTRH